MKQSMVSPTYDCDKKWQLRLASTIHLKKRFVYQNLDAMVLVLWSNIFSQFFMQWVKCIPTVAMFFSAQFGELVSGALSNKTAMM